MSLRGADSINRVVLTSSPESQISRETPIPSSSATCSSPRQLSSVVTSMGTKAEAHVCDHHSNPDPRSTSMDLNDSR